MQHQLSKWQSGAAQSCHSSVLAQRRVYNDLGKSGGQQPDSAPAKALQTAEAMQAALRTALVKEASAVMQAHKDDDILRPLHLFANLMLSLWIGACFASRCLISWVGGMCSWLTKHACSAAHVAALSM